MSTATTPLDREDPSPKTPRPARPTTPRAAYRHELATTAGPYIGGIVLAAVVIGTLVGTILYVAFSTGGSPDFKAGVTNMSLIAVVPAVAGIRLAHRNFVSDHRPTIDALRNLGVTGAFFRRRLMVQGLLLAVLGTASAVVLGRLLATPLFRVILLGLNKELPHTWGSPLDVAWSSAIVIVLLYLLGVGTVRVDKTLAREDAGAGESRTRSWSLTTLAGWTLAGVNIVAGVWCMLTEPPGWVVLVLVFTLPFLAATLAGPVGRFLARVVSGGLRRIGGWSSPAVGIRSAERVGTMSRVGLATALVAIPLAGFTGAQAALWAADHAAAEKFSDAPVVVDGDHRLLEPARAEEVCGELGDDCLGVVYWQPSAYESEGETSVPRERASDYSLAGSDPRVLVEVLNVGWTFGTPEGAVQDEQAPENAGQEEQAPEDAAQEQQIPGQQAPEGAVQEEQAQGGPAESGSPFYPGFMVPFSGLSDDPPVNPDWGLPVLDAAALDGRGESGDGDLSAPGGRDLGGLRVEPADEWARHVDMDSQIMYGPHGDGTAGFIPTAAYTLLAICLVLAVAVMGKRARMHWFFAPLWLLGRTRLSLRHAQFWAILFPYLAAALTAVLCGLWYTLVVHVAVTGRPGAFMPYLPPGLWVLFGVVFLATSATAFLPAPERRRPVTAD
ncbi:FtsX-like permease family protein [Corynebacterium frankenforstense]|uniref:FtsX-like permease family protein n=1 Tax=Corynebacterium frankenforstense TaxID=1230998 RepID=UPI0009510C5F|nr:FtsX-like permease family protein [Corynebacterium frankenforstense]